MSHASPPERRAPPPLPPCTARLGCERLAYADGESRMRWAIPETPQFENTGGTIHGGYLCVFADALLGSSMSSLLESGKLMVTPDINVQFLDAVRPGQTLEGRGRVSHKGNTMAFLEAEVWDGESDTRILLAQATGLVRDRRPGQRQEGEPPPYTPPQWEPSGANLLADPPPWVADMGVDFTQQGDGTAELVWPIADPAFVNRGGTIQGGYLCLIADAAMGFALMGGREDARAMATTALNIHLLRPALVGMTLTVRAEVLRRGYRFGFMRCVLTADDDPARPIATANATGLIRH